MGIAVLIRHGRSTANVDGILAGRAPGFHLHDSGRDQAHAVARAFQGITPTSVHVSPLTRTLETATIIFGSHGFATADELLECDYGTWSARRIDEIAKDPLWDLVHERPSAAEFPGGESVRQVHDRIVAFVRRTSAPDGLHVFVTHADPIMMLVTHAMGAPLDHYQRLNIEPCSMTVLLVDGPEFGVVATNVPTSGAAETLQSLLHWERTSVGGAGGANEPDDPLLRPA